MSDGMVENLNAIKSPADPSERTARRIMTSTISLLALSACGGEDGSSSLGAPPISSDPREGVAYKGLLESFRVFIDTNGNGVFDVDEPFTLTDEAGQFSLLGARNTVIHGASTESTLDRSSNRILDNLFASAPPEATVISPYTTIIQQTGLAEISVREAFGFNVNLLHYNPFAAENIGSDEARAVEIVAQQVVNITRNLTVVGESAGLNSRVAFDIASAALNSAVTTHVSSGAAGALVLSGDTTISSVLNSYRAGLVDAGHPTAVFDALRPELATSLSLINQRMQAVSDLSSAEAQAVFGLPFDLYDEVQTAAAAIAAGNPNPGLTLDSLTAITAKVSENGYTATAPIDGGGNSGGAGGSAPPAPVPFSLSSDAAQNVTVGTGHGNVTFSKNGTDYVLTPQNGSAASIAEANVNSFIVNSITAVADAIVLSGETLTGSGGVIINKLEGDSDANLSEITATGPRQVNVTGNVTFTGDLGLFASNVSVAGGYTFDFSGQSDQTAALDITGDAANNVIVGGGGADTITGGAGDDTINGGAGADTLTGGAGADTLTGGAGADQFIVDAGADSITDFGVGADKVNIAAGATLAAAVTANYTAAVAGDIDNQAAAAAAVFTVANDVEFDASAATDTTNGITITAAGNAAASTLVGTDQGDVITGGDGDDTITGGAGADTLTGGGGNNTYRYTAAAEAAPGETITFNAAGTETIEITDSAATSVSVDLSAINAGALLTDLDAIVLGDADSATLLGAQITGLTLAVTGVAGGDGESLTVNGTAGIDTIDLSNVTVTDTRVTINGLENDDIITGTAFGDIINGGAGNDTITGGARDDTITGGADADTLTGGAGNNLFTFSMGDSNIISNAGNGDDSGEDLITDWEVGDAILLTGTINNNFSVSNNVAVGTQDPQGTSGTAERAFLNTVYLVDFTNNGSFDLAVRVTTNGSAPAFVDSGAPHHATILDLQIGDGGHSVTGGQNNDTITGGAGNDTITGGAGADTLTGGAGADTFVFDTVILAANANTITDFEADDDILQFDATTFDNYTNGGTAVIADVATVEALADDASADDEYVIIDTAANIAAMDVTAELGGEAFVAIASDTGAIYYADDGDGGDIVQIGTITAGEVADILAANFSFVA